MKRLPTPDHPRRPLSVAAKLELGAEIVATYVRVRWLLARYDLPETVAALRAQRERTDSARERTDSANDARADNVAGIRLGRIVGRSLGALPLDSRCLVRSLVLMNLLARRGIGSSLVIGVRSEPDFAAHAWVESAGTPLLPPFEAEYSRLVEI